MISDWRERLRSTFEPAIPTFMVGDGSHVDLAIRKITLKSGSEISVEPGTVTAIVGANNAGKSTLLREVMGQLQRDPGIPAPERLSVESVEVIRHGSLADFVAWLAERSHVVSTGNGPGLQRMPGIVLNPWQISQAWQDGQDALGAQVWPYLVFYANADARLSVGGSAELRASIADPPSHPVHYLQDDRTVLDRLSSITRSIFGQPLTLDTLGRMVRLRVGQLEQPAPPVDNIPPEYINAMMSLRPLDEQGDGMRSLLGQLLPIITGQYPIVVIDEPEAFLHPPQAHALGVQLGRLASEFSIQVMLATHDRSLLAGLLSSGVKTSVVRLSRDPGSEAVAYQLDAASLQMLWTDPVLKYTNVLDGLFHRLVVLAEGEGDCGFLAAALDCPAGQGCAIPANEILFVPTGGKDGMAKVANALSAVRVPLVAAPDLDVLSDKGTLRRLVISVGSEWTPDMSLKWDQATAHLRAPREPATGRDILQAVSSVLNDALDEPYSAELQERVRAQMRSRASAWDLVKEYGVRAFKGQAHSTLDDLIQLLDAARVVVVRDGVLERLAPEISVRKGPGWLQAALAAGAQCNAATQAHVKRILAAGLTERSREDPSLVSDRAVPS